MVVHFAFLFHIYQPPTQIPVVIRQITGECYRPLIDALKTHPEARITLNINGTLTEQLHDYGFNDVIDGLADLGNKGQVEFTGSAKFHPLLPLIPEPEIVRQIELNNETNKYFFGKAYHPRGFFPPEMAVSDDVHSPVKQLGFDWMIMGGIANTVGWPTRTFTHHPNGLILVFRDDVISIDCAFDKVNNVEAFANRLKYQDPTKDYYVILAMDGETFGHHIKHAFKNFLVPLFDNLPNRNDIKMCTVSEIIAKYPRGEAQVPRASSWSTMSYDLQRDVPFPLWFEKDNPIHLEQYRVMMYSTVLVNLASKLHESMNDEKREALKNARNFLDRAVFSCQTWWASKRPWYSRDMILRGLNELILAAVNARASIPDNSVDIRDAGALIIDALLKSQNSIILAL